MPAALRLCLALSLPALLVDWWESDLALLVPNSYGEHCAAVEYRRCVFSVLGEDAALIASCLRPAEGGEKAVGDEQCLACLALRGIAAGISGVPWSDIVVSAALMLFCSPGKRW